jgi:NADPH:quinone reductase-like Zn-dependent oxidoreductase
MTTTYRALMVTTPGGPEALECVDLPVEQPGPGQLRVRVRATGVGSTNLFSLRARREDLPKIFALVAEKKIDPLISITFPLLAAGKAIELLATGSVEGKIVLTNA